MYRRLATLTAKTGLATGIGLLLTLGTLMPGVSRATADDCPDGTAQIIDVDGNPQCVALEEGQPGPEPTATPSTPPTPPPSDLPPPTEDPGTAPPEDPTPSAVPESAPAVITPPEPAPLPSETTPAETSDPAPVPAPAPAPAPAPTEPSPTPDAPEDTNTPAPAVVPPEPPANAENTGVIVPGDGPRLLWAVAAGASASGLLAAIVAFYLLSVRPFFLARRRPGALS